MKECPKCGKKIREGSAFCVNCGAKLSGGKYAKKSTRRPLKRLLVIVTLIAIIVIIASFLLSQRNTQKNVSLTAESEVTIIVPDNLSVDPEEVRFENQKMFVDSQLLLKVQADTSYESIEELVSKENGVIIGYISFSGDYHIDFPDGKTYLELEAIQKKWSNESFIDTVTFNKVFLSNTSSVDYTNDPWKETWFLGGITDPSEKWTEGTPSGNNWWAEAIYMPSVWKMDLWNTVEKGTVNVGVIDSVFAPNHKDLKKVIAKTWNNSFDEKNVESGALSHGTHVSGIIAAELGNDVGIAGVASCVEPKLYCYAMHGKSDEVYGSTMEYKYAIAMLLEEGAEIINISMGVSDTVVFAAEQGSTAAREVVTSSDESLAIFLKDALSAGYDFLIVKSAGNTSNDYFVQCEVTQENPFGYRLAEPNETGAISAKCSANWNLFAGIRDVSVRDRIIVVGAAQKAETSSGNVYVSADFSNKDCDVYAPGVDILSLAYGDTDTVSFPGTSQATPIVSGIATLLKAVNPNLSAIQIKEIILKSVPSLHEQSPNTEEQVALVNAAVAVYYGYGWSASEMDGNRDSAILGTVYEVIEEDGEKQSYGITNATVSIFSHNQNEPVRVIDTKETGGGFNGYFTAGNYSVSIEAEGYIKHTSSFVLEENDVIYLSIQLYPEKIAEKKLQQVNVTYSDGAKGQTVFNYNSSGLLISSIFASTYSEGSQETVYSYDSDNRLTAVQLTGDHWHAGFPSAEYNYDSNGYLIRSAAAEGSIIEYLYENDSAGRPIKVTMNSDFQTTVSNYTYSESGNAAEIIISVTDYQGNQSQGYASYEFTYDAQGRIQTETRNGTDGSYNHNYIYDYVPFVCVASGNSTPHSIYLADIKGHPIWEIENVVVKSMKQDADGYLTQLIADSGAIFEFVYDKSNKTDDDLLKTESQYELNTFLSYFSQQWFNEVDPKTYEAKTDPFDAQNADPAQLIRFVHQYTNINNSQVLYDSLDQESKVHLSLDYVNGKLQQFFGISISSQDVQNSGYELREGNIYFNFALGETYNYMTVARSWDEVSNGTFHVEFDIYRGEGKYMYAGGPIVIEDVYGYSTEDAQQDADLIYYKSGTATVRQTGKGNNAAYQLLQYGLEGQSQNVDNISFSDIPAEYTFSSGAGGWSTGLKIGTDGYFEGQYHDSNMGETGDGYTRGTVYYCNFSGKFSEPDPVNEYTYKVSLEQFSVANQEGVEHIENEIKYIASAPYGFDGPNEYYIYLPGIPSSMMPQSAFDWVSRLYGNNFGTYEVYVICSANGELPFVGEFR